MNLLANDLSIHRQFHHVSVFRAALARLMTIRRVARRFKREVQCHRGLVNVEPVQGVAMQQAIQHLNVNERRAVMGWLTQGGPFWDDLREHGPDDWLECRGKVVTDSAVGEAAYRTLHAVECGLVSVTPSDWNLSPIDVIWQREAEGLDNQSTILENWWDAATLENRLQNAVPPIQSWDDLREVSTNQFENLTVAENCFRWLDGTPFARSPADRIVVLLGILDRLAQAFDTDGRRTPEGHRIYQDYFTGENALFSDSSTTEKNNFRKDLTFRHPNDPKKDLFCPWHGKVRHMTLRLHYWWSGKAGDPVFVVYAGRKITRQ